MSPDPLLAVVNSDRGDPAVLRLPGLGYLATISSGNEPDAFPIMFSPDLVNWTPSGHVFPRGAWPHWAKSNMWVAEIHKVDEDRYDNKGFERKRGKELQYNSI